MVALDVESPSSFKQKQDELSEQLKELLRTKDISSVVEAILYEIFSTKISHRIYVLEFDVKKESMRRLYEVKFEGDKLLKLELEPAEFQLSSLMVKRILNKETLFFRSIEELSAEFAPFVKVFQDNKVYSLMSIPIDPSEPGITEYITVAIVGGDITPHELEQEWFQAIFYVVSICIKLKESEQRAHYETMLFEQLYKNMPLGYLRMEMIYDPNGEIIDYRIVDVNLSFEKVTGVSKELVLHRTAKEVGMAGSSLNFALDNMRQLFECGEAMVTEYEFGDQFQRAIIYSPENNIVVALISDITDLKRIERNLIVAKEKAEEADRLKSAFLANMSHEIRTPLNAIVGFSDLLSGDLTPEERSEYVSIIKRNNEQLLSLVSDILDLSKIESGAMTLNEEEFDINDSVKELMFANSLKKPVEVELRMNIPEQGLRIVADRYKVQQVISNLLSNAMKFTERGYIELGYEVHYSKMLFYVQDTGIGMNQEQLKNVFNRFVKYNTFIKGVGLGLPICKGIIEKMDGRIGVESQENVGTRFWFEIPIKNRMVFDQGVGLQGKSIDMDKQEPVINKTVLVAEDTESNYILITAILKKEYDLVRAKTGAEALEYCRTNTPALILMDIKMPIMDGLEATRKIREFNTSVPIIALTAFAFDSDRQRSLDAGCTDYISKPISPSILKDAVRRYVMVER